MRWIVVILLMVSCSRSFEPLDPNPMQELRPNTYVEDLPLGVVRGDMIIRGTVTTSDSCGNFYQSMIVQDPTGVIELRFAFYDVYSLFKQGELVSVKLFNREIIYENGIMSANIGSLALTSQTVFRQGLIDEIPPLRVKISDIDSTIIGRQVELRGGEFVNGGREPWSGEQRYSIGKEGIVIYTTPFASYANEPLPFGTATIRGIVTLYNGKFQLKMSSPSDCVME